MDRPVEPRVQHYRLWYEDMKEITEGQPNSENELEDHPIEIKDYRHIYREWKYRKQHKGKGGKSNLPSKERTKKEEITRRRRNGQMHKLQPTLPINPKT